MAQQVPQSVDRIELLRLSAEAESDPRSVAKALRGEYVRGLAGDRIRRVLARNGLLIAKQAA